MDAAIVTDPAAAKSSVYRLPRKVDFPFGYEVSVVQGAPDQDDRAAEWDVDTRTIVVDLSHARDATTSAFARLVLLRRYLLRTGRDLRLTGLSHRAARLYEVSRLDRVLPAWQRPLQLA